MPNRKKEAAISDANILIDFVAVDEDLIQEMVRFWEKVYVPDVILYEVKDLSFYRAKALGLTVISTPIASLPMLPGLSFQDRTCLYFVKENGWVCITNDKLLRKECVNFGAEVIWGLRMILHLVENKQISKNRAREAATNIQTINPTISIKILDNFLNILERL